MLTIEEISITKNTIMNERPQLMLNLPEYVNNAEMMKPIKPVSITDCGNGAYLLINYSMEKEIYKVFASAWLLNFIEVLSISIKLI